MGAYTCSKERGIMHLQSFDAAAEDRWITSVKTLKEPQALLID
jgi:hypothetical protein